MFQVKKLIVLLIIHLLSACCVFGQFQIEWQQSYGSMASDWGYDIVQTGEGYLVTGIAGSGGGQVECFEEGEGGGWIFKIDDSGNLIWQKCFDYAHGLRMVNTIGNLQYYLIGGTISDPYPDDYNLWIAKVDSVGNIIWQRTLGNMNGILGGTQYGELTSDGGVIATAQIDSQGGDITSWYGGYDGWIIKQDSLGNTEWNVSIGSPQFEFINGIIQTSDGGYFAGLYGAPNGAGGTIDCGVQDPSNSEAIIVKIDANGNVEWHQCYGGTGNDGVARLLELVDGYLIAGWGESNDGNLEGGGWHPGWNNIGTPTMDVWLIRIDYTGNIIWQKCYGGSKGESPRRIFQSEDGGFVVFANTHSFDGDVVGNPSGSTENPSIWIFKVNKDGQLLWQQCIGGISSERVYDVVKHSDYKYTLVGEMRFSPSGDVNCSNFVSGSRQNYWIFSITDTTVNIVDHFSKGFDMKVYPNPADEYVITEYHIKEGYQDVHLEILDASLRKVSDVKLQGRQSQVVIPVKSYPQGIYLVRLIGDNAFLNSQKIMVVKN